MTATEGSTTTGRVDDEALAAIAAGLADADPGAFLAAGSCRRWALIASNELYSAWVIAWPTGTGLGMHDHGGSSAAVQVVRGILRERYVAEGGDVAGGLVVRWLDPGSLHVLAGEHRHEVVNVGDVEAVSVHVYSPPLVETSFRDDPEIDLR